jgi:hypothetical protein
MKEYLILHFVHKPRGGDDLIQPQQDALNEVASQGYTFVTFLTWKHEVFWALFERETCERPEIDLLRQQVALLRQLLRAYGHEPEA